MEIFGIRPHFEKQDLEVARRRLASELNSLGKILVIIRGDSVAAEEFSRRVKELTDRSTWRKTIWVRDSRIIGSRREAAWFGEDSTACAVVLSFLKEPVGLLCDSSSTYDISVMLQLALSWKSVGDKIAHARQRFS